MFDSRRELLKATTLGSLRFAEYLRASREPGTVHGGAKTIAPA
jgi:hypothetical protein